MPSYSDIAENSHMAPCPFCSEEVETQTLGKTGHWKILANRAPYVADHVMLVPHAHVEHLYELPAEALAEFWPLAEKIRAWLVSRGHRGHNILLRDEEEFRAIGKSMAHLHVHFIPSCIMYRIPAGTDLNRHYYDDSEFETLVRDIAESFQRA